MAVSKFSGKRGQGESEAHRRFGEIRKVMPSVGVCWVSSQWAEAKKKRWKECD